MLTGNTIRANTAVEVNSEGTNTFGPEFLGMGGKGMASGTRRVRIGDDNDASSSVAETDETAKSTTNPGSGHASRPQAHRAQTRAVSRQASLDSQSPDPPEDETRGSTPTILPRETSAHHSIRDIE